MKYFSYSTDIETDTSGRATYPTPTLADIYVMRYLLTRAAFATEII